jgi:two-component system NarL family sensor kinase
MDTKETTTYNAVLIAAVVIGTIILYFILSIIRQQRKHRLLYKATIEAEITTLEKERLRLAADLHDELGPTLSAAKLKLSNIDDLPPDDEKMRTEAMQHIDNILQQVRSIANDLMPNTLLRNGPVAAIEEYINRTAANDQLNIELYAVNFPVLPQNAQVHIYRIMQELIHNTVKHARAKRLVIELNTNNNMLVMSTADNGIGFRQESTPGTSMGLNNLRSRTEMLGGEMFIKTKPGKGTMFTFHIPLTVVKPKST